MELTSDQEEMALAFAKQLETERAEDQTFVRNFIADFTRALEIEGHAKLEDFDFSGIKRAIEAERAKREGMTREERRELAEDRRRIREANRERYGYALVDEERVETNYAVEPPCLFIGRGQHPLRGRWKPRVGYGDIELNLSPDASTPSTPDGSTWGGRTFDPRALWIARWRDKLTGKLKYVWIAETAPSKQRREIKKFNLARKLKRHLPEVHRLISEKLGSSNPTERRVATAAFLIERLKLRCGDEKDPDELDTVGVTTFTRSNVRICPPSEVVFDFLGKGAVRFHRKVELPPAVVENLNDFISSSPNERIFPELRSERVNALFGHAMESLTSKVFRTHYASEAVRQALKRFRIYLSSSDFKKLYVARRANLEAAKVLNHRRKLPRRWEERVERHVSRIKRLRMELERVGGKPPTQTRRLRAKRIRRKLWEAKLKLKLLRKTRGYNLSTSLNSYIDPRVYARWAKRVGWDWRRIYPKSMQQKFGWVEGTRHPG